MKRSRPKQVSDKRKRENIEREAMSLKKFGERPWECRFHDFTTANDADLMHRVAELGGLNCHGEVNRHEIIKASAWRAGRLDPDNVTTLCNFHNGWVEDHPIEARKLGLSKRPPV